MSRQRRMPSDVWDRPVVVTACAGSREGFCDCQNVCHNPKPTADAAHVAAVAEALAKDCFDCQDGQHDAVVHTYVAREAVQTLTPLIRARVAAEIRAMPTAYGTDALSFAEGRDQAARIAEGSTT